MRKINSKIKRALSLVVAMVMVLSMGVFSMAASSDTNMTNSSTQWTINAKAGDTVRLYASPANSSWMATGFTKPAEGEQNTDQVIWTSTNNAVANVTAEGFVDAPEGITGLAGLYCAYADVKVVGDETGSCSIQATHVMGNKTASVNFTIIVNPAKAEDATGVQVYVYDLETDRIQSGSLTVSPSGSLKFATVMDAMKKFADVNSNFSYTEPFTGYIQTIRYGEASKTAADLEGWNYLVLPYFTININKSSIH